MKNIILVISMLVMNLVFGKYAFTAEEETQLFMADGQLKSHPIRVFITKDINKDMKPRLRLTGSHAITKKKKGEDRLIEPMLIAQNQKSEQTVNETKIALTGTLLLFDLSHYPIPSYKAVMRLTPTLIWSEKSRMKEVQRVAIGQDEIYLANPLPAFIWPFAIVAILILFIVAVAKRGNRKVIQFICDKDGHLSLSRSQVASWTVAIGGMVTAYGLMRLEVPSIPSSLVALMGLSLATGGISYVQASKEKNTEASEGKDKDSAKSDDHKTNISDLVMDFSPEEKGVLSLARAQMVFWTGLTLTLFVAKSILDGTLWDVPWELVALMGLSQVSYLAPKINVKTQNS